MLRTAAPLKSICMHLVVLYNDKLKCDCYGQKEQIHESFICIKKSDREYTKKKHQNTNTYQYKKNSRFII